MSIRILLSVLTLFTAGAFAAEIREPGSSESPIIPEETRMAYANTWSIGGTVLPVAAAWYLLSDADDGRYAVPLGTFAVAGLLVGPSMGQMYAGSYGRGTVGILIRGLGGAFGAAGMAQAVSNVFCMGDGAGSGSSCQHEQDSGMQLMWVGVAIYTGGALFSLLDTPRAVIRQTDRLRRERYGFTPTVAPDPYGGLTPGALAWARF
jgi:hypothetical protein